MSDDIKVGDRVMHPKMVEWGLGQVVTIANPNVTVYFEVCGEKTLRLDLVSLKKLEGEDDKSATLDSKFNRKRGGRRKRVDDPNLFNGGRPTSRKQFIESLGAECANWNWSWSFVNHDTRQIFFGAWQDFIKGNKAMIFSDDWKVRRGVKQKPWPESRENIRLVEEEGYSLHVYTMILDPDSESEFEVGVRKIGAIRNDVTPAKLLKENGDWYAVFPEDAPT